MTDKSREAFEAYFKALYIKTGFISSKAETEATWQAAIDYAKEKAIAECQQVSHVHPTDDYFDGVNAAVRMCIDSIKEVL